MKPRAIRTLKSTELEATKGGAIWHLNALRIVSQYDAQRRNRIRHFLTPLQTD